MKKKYLLIATFLVANWGLYAQEFKKNDLFNFTKITKFITDISDVQKTAINQAIEKRKENLKNIKNPEDRKIHNKEYNRALLHILTEEQETKLFGASIKTEKLKEFTKKEANSKFDNFPVDYKQILLQKLENFNYQIQLIEKKFPFDFQEMQVRKQEIKTAKRNFVQSEMNEIKKVLFFTQKKENDCTQLTKQQSSLYRDYHFYLLKDKIKYKPELTTIINNKGFKNLKKKLTNCGVTKKIENTKIISKQDSITQAKIITQLQKEIKSKIDNTIDRLESLDINYRDIDAFLISKTIINKQKVNRAKRKEEDAEKSFYEKAQKAGLNNNKTERLLELIKERNEALTNYKQSQKQEHQTALFSLTETSEIKKPFIIKKEFAQKLNDLLTYKEYISFVGQEFRKKSLNQAKKETKEIIGNKELSEEQIKELHKLIYLYHFNQNISKSYYAHDKQLLKQKLGVLTYRFEKEYQKLAKELELQPSQNSKKIDNRTFQWN
ncbi:hypothetical protein [Wenyingzhuangia aestuarii]|uniref:hypothetical protein n=1 Tax=Wenyingzhuangia aestuarii TaxID=1647582 RepID=UPI00143B8F10|nr:hypothetical protein [Wenyingzhuangia aestuarii]NJB82056.1 hypothetical protein [Wenyingzhuangia aestuarii]